MHSHEPIKLSVTSIELEVNLNDNSGGEELKPVHFSSSELWAEILNTERCAVYETEAIVKYLV
jgi:hypothetical protein